MNTAQDSDKIALLSLAFNGLAEADLQEMAALTRLCAYPAGHVLCQEGAYEDVFYILAQGSAVISKTISPQEGERVLRIAGRGDLIGEMALVQNAPRSATVRATTDCTVLEMNKQDFEAMLSRSPSMAINIIRTTVNRMRENDQTAIQYLQNTNKVLRQLDRNKLEFIQVAAHELRTPLTVVKGYVDLLRSFPNLGANPALTGIMEGILKGAERMHEVVNTMLDVTRIDNESLKLNAAPVPLKQVTQDVVQEFSKAAAERKITLIVELDPLTPVINGDPILIQKALAHLIVNAIKYTPDGGQVTVASRMVALENQAPAVEISVRDTGIGLDAEQHELVFEKFYQVGDVKIHSSGKTTFKGGGPGLGLAIVRGVARAHGGKTWVESSGHDEVNFPGCTFYLQLPVNPPGV
jgi:signal transduction histidine kinase